MEKWLLLTDYASKYRISVSTLRRRIKAGAQAHRFEAGRYYLQDQYEPQAEASMPGHVSMQQLSQISVASATMASTNMASTATPVAAFAAPLAVTHISDEPLITTTSKLLNELKQAYTLILHEKEEQIIYLKEEIADLKTLVRVLESDNARLRKAPSTFRD